MASEMVSIFIIIIQRKQKILKISSRGDLSFFSRWHLSLARAGQARALARRPPSQHAEPESDAACPAAGPGCQWPGAHPGPGPGILRLLLSESGSRNRHGDRCPALPRPPGPVPASHSEPQTVGLDVTVPGPGLVIHWKSP
jgi:hypothetical protein